MRFFFFFTIAIFIVGCSSPKKNTRRGFELELNNTFFKGITPMEIFFPEEKRKENSTILNHRKKKNTSTTFNGRKKKNSTQKKKNRSTQNKQKKKNTSTTLNNPKKKKIKRKDYKKKRSEISEYALTLNGKKRVTNKKFRNDCSGFVLMVYNHFDYNLFDLERDKLKENGKWVNGSKLIYKYSKKNGKVFLKNPKLGDFIFFDNTTDRNRDGKLNDLFTHIAIVIKIEDDGTIHYIHKSNRGINIQKMNLKYPNSIYIKVGDKKKRVNSYLRKVKKRDNKKTKYISAQMFRSFGSVFK